MHQLRPARPAWRSSRAAPRQSRMGPDANNSALRDGGPAARKPSSVRSSPQLSPLGVLPLQPLRARTSLENAAASGDGVIPDWGCVQATTASRAAGTSSKIHCNDRSLRAQAGATSSNASSGFQRSRVSSTGDAGYTRSRFESTACFDPGQGMTDGVSLFRILGARISSSASSWTA